MLFNLKKSTIFYFSFSFYFFYRLFGTHIWSFPNFTGKYSVNSGAGLPSALTIRDISKVRGSVELPDEKLSDIKEFFPS